jgi:hypothetical protein
VRDIWESRFGGVSSRRSVRSVALISGCQSHHYFASSRLSSGRLSACCRVPPAMNGFLTQPLSPPSQRPQSTGRAPKAQVDGPNGTVKRMRPPNRRSSSGGPAAAAARRGGKLPGSKLASATPLTSADVSASEEVSSDQSTDSDSPEETDSSRQQRFQNVDPGNQYEQVRPFLLSHLSSTRE